MGWQLAHVTARVNAAVPRLVIQLFIDKQLCIHYRPMRYNHMTHLHYILGSFEPVTPNPLISSTTTTIGSQFHFLLYLKCMLLIFSSLCRTCRPFCAYKMHYKHSKPYIGVHSGNSVHSGKRTHPKKTAANQNRQY